MFCAMVTAKLMGVRSVDVHSCVVPFGCCVWNSQGLWFSRISHPSGTQSGKFPAVPTETHPPWTPGSSPSIKLLQVGLCGFRFGSSRGPKLDVSEWQGTEFSLLVLKSAKMVKWSDYIKILVPCCLYIIGDSYIVTNDLLSRSLFFGSHFKWMDF